MIILRMMLRLFTSIFGTTHPAKEDEARYAWMLLGLVVAIVCAMGLMMWLVMNFVR